MLESSNHPSTSEGTSWKLDFSFPACVFNMLGRLFTFRAEGWQLVTKAFPSSGGHDQEKIPAGKCQVDGPELQRSEPRKVKRVLQMLRDLFGPWKIYQTRAKPRGIRGCPSTTRVFRPAVGCRYRCHQNAAAPACSGQLSVWRTWKKTRVKVRLHHRLPPGAAAEHPGNDSALLSSAAAQQFAGPLPPVLPPPCPTVPEHLNQKRQQPLVFISKVLFCVYRILSVELVTEWVSHLSWPQEDHTSTPNRLVLTGFVYNPSTIRKALSTSIYTSLKTDQLHNTYTNDQVTNWILCVCELIWPHFARWKWKWTLPAVLFMYVCLFEKSSHTSGSIATIHFPSDSKWVIDLISVKQMHPRVNSSQI